VLNIWARYNLPRRERSIEEAAGDTTLEK